MAMLGSANPGLELRADMEGAWRGRNAREKGWGTKIAFAPHVFAS
jgi:hypothetical protein